MDRELKSTFVAARFEQAEAERLSAIAQATGQTTSTVLRRLVKLADLNDQGELVVNDSPVLYDEATMTKLDGALDALDKAQAAREQLATVREHLLKKNRYRM